MEETKEAIKEEEEIIYKIDKKDEDRISLINNIIKEDNRDLDKHKSYITIEYLELKFKSIFFNNKLFKRYPYYRFAISTDSYARNYFSAYISIYFYSNEEHYIKDCSTQKIEIQLGELFLNCSSICFSKLSGDLLTRYAFNNVNPLDQQRFVTEYMEILVEFCSLLKYSKALYTCSEETNQFAESYLQKNWKEVERFKNKRNSHTIVYYTKDL